MIVLILIALGVVCVAVAWSAVIVGNRADESIKQIHKNKEEE